MPSLVDFLKYEPKPLSARALAGFIDRLTTGRLRYPDEFLVQLRENLERTPAAVREPMAE